MRSTYAYTLLLRCLASEIVLIDQDHESAEGEAMDLYHSTLFALPLRVWAGDFADGGGVNIIVLDAGVAQQSGGTRLELLKRNPQVCQEIIPQIVSYTIDALLIVVTNQINILTEAAWGLSGLPAKQLIGSGTILDMARFLYLLNKHFHVEPRSVHAFIIGKDGDSQVPVWSLTNIAGIRLEDFGRLNGNELSDDEKETIALDRRRTAYEITQRKGAIYYEIAAGRERIIETILRNENSVLTVSSLVLGAYHLHDVYISLPSIVNQQGIALVLELLLAADERFALNKSVQVVRAVIESHELQVA